MSIKRTPHYNSAANLRSEATGNQSDPKALTEPIQTALPLSKTIQNLEELLHEALQIARLAAEDESEPATVPGSSEGSRRRPSQGIRTRATAFVEHLGQTDGDSAPVNRPQSPPRISFLRSEAPNRKKHVEDALLACEAAQQEVSKIKASLVPPTITVTDEDWELQPLPTRHQSLPTLSEHHEPTEPVPAEVAPKQSQAAVSRRRKSHSGRLSKKEIKKHIKAHDAPPVVPRTSSQKSSFPRSRDFVRHQEPMEVIFDAAEPKSEDGSPGQQDKDDVYLHTHGPGHEGHFSQIFGVPSKQPSIDLGHPSRSATQKVDLRGVRHVDLHQGMEDVNLHESCNHRPIARDWPNSRKRFAATIACVNTACLGIIIGIYAGEVPAIQYVIVDFHHYTILGNVLLYLGLVIATLFLWPLPLLHGRKPYTLAALAVALCLQIPQGIAVGAYRSPYVRTYRVLLLLSRAVSGFALGFANINMQSTLLDLFGASLQSGNPHQEIVDDYDVRRHGGGMGLWLGIWSWCTIGSISIGFLIGACIISATNVTWGFWTCLLLLTVVLLLNVIAPELRRSAYRRTVAEVRGKDGMFRSRIARGEVKMHLKSSGPYWWGEEVKAGIEMCWLMLKQPGFLILAVYTAWVYAQFTVILMVSIEFPHLFSHPLTPSCSCSVPWHQHTTCFDPNMLACAPYPWEWELF